MTKHTPIFPGAMTPAQMLRKFVLQLSAVAIVASTTAIFTALFIMFN